MCDGLDQSAQGHTLPNGQLKTWPIFVKLSCKFPAQGRCQLAICKIYLGMRVCKLGCNRTKWRFRLESRSLNMYESCCSTVTGRRPRPQHIYRYKSTCFNFHKRPNSEGLLESLCTTIRNKRHNGLMVLYNYALFGMSIATVDGRNPAPPQMSKTP